VYQIKNIKITWWDVGHGRLGKMKVQLLFLHFDLHPMRSLHSEQQSFLEERKILRHLPCTDRSFFRSRAEHGPKFHQIYSSLHQQTFFCHHSAGLRQYLLLEWPLLIHRKRRCQVWLPRLLYVDVQPMWLHEKYHRKDENKVEMRISDDQCKKKWQ